MFSTCLFMLAWQGIPLQQEKFKVEFVTLDIGATHKGEMVTDLQKDDFVIKENGKRVDVSFFDRLDFRQNDGDTQGEKQLQQVILALDFESVVREEMVQAFRQVRQFIGRLDPAFRYSINLYALERGSLTKGFSQDLSEVLAALNRYQDLFTSDRFKGNSWDNDNPLAARPSRRQSPLVSDIVSLSESVDFCLKMVESACGCIESSVAEFTQEQAFRSERVIGELEILAYKFRENSDLKTMLLVSPGFALGNLDSVRSLIGKQVPRNMCNGSILSLGRMRLGDQMQLVAHACIKNRVVFHTFDVFNRNGRKQGAGSHFNSVYGVYATDMESGLRGLARESGGSFKPAFRLDNAANKVLARNRFFYVLGYSSPPGKSGKYRTIKVKVKRKGVVLSHRRGYFGS